MFYLNNYFIILMFFSVISSSYAQLQSEITPNYVKENEIPVQLLESDIYLIANEINDENEVDVKLYYESLCPDCIQFDKEQFSPAVQKLSQYVEFQTFPYGNARTIKEKDAIKFECQHGPPECYGNKLHACAIDYLKNITEAIVFNSCMMGGSGGGSNDAAADRCAGSLGVDSNPIKVCAKGDRGTKLLEYYGDESQKANFSYVPYILINGKVNDGNDFLKDICAAFAVSPPPCVAFSAN